MHTSPTSLVSWEGTKNTRTLTLAEYQMSRNRASFRQNDQWGEGVNLDTRGHQRALGKQKRETYAVQVPLKPSRVLLIVDYYKYMDPASPVV